MDATDSLLYQIEALHEHWVLGPRGIGQTHALRVGAVNNDHPIFLLAHDIRSAYEFRDRAAFRGNLVHPLTVHSLEKLRGSRLPPLADHFVLGRMFGEAAQTIRDLRRKLRDVQAIVSQPADEE